jgi:hypothetical protein
MRQVGGVFVAANEGPLRWSLDFSWVPMYEHTWVPIHMPKIRFALHIPDRNYRVISGVCVSDNNEM